VIPVALLAFSFLPMGHGPRPPEREPNLDRPFFVGDMQRLVPQEKLPFFPTETASPVLDDAQTRLYAGTRDGNVRCRFRSRTVWTFHADGAILAAPTVDGETLYVGSADGKLYALNRFTGAPRWQLDVHEELTTSPTVSGGRIFVMSSEQSVTAVDGGEGKSLWKFHRDPPGGFTIRGDAATRVAHGTVAALAPENGSAKWTRQVSGNGDYLDVDWIDAPENDSRIYVASAKAGILALDAATGETAWTHALAGANHVLVEGGRVVGGGRGEVVALDRGNGNLLWRLELPKDRFPTQPVAMNGIVLVAQDRGPLLGVDLDTGETRGAFEPGSGFSQAVFAKPGVAYVISNAGSLFSLGLLP
jgi:outer membrane protein assembly factor BamB